jgi:hypothetical protein
LYLSVTLQWASRTILGNLLLTLIFTAWWWGNYKGRYIFFGEFNNWGVLADLSCWLLTCGWWGWNSHVGNKIINTVRFQVTYSCQAVKYCTGG